MKVKCAICGGPAAGLAIVANVLQGETFDKSVMFTICPTSNIQAGAIVLSSATCAAKWLDQWCNKTVECI